MTRSREVARAVKRVVVGSPMLTAALMLADDYWWGARLSLGRITTLSGAAHEAMTTDESVAYIEQVVDDYQSYGGVGCFHGRVGELGPGDSAGVALLLRNRGAAQVDLIDRYQSVRDTRQQESIYEALSRRHALGVFRGGERWQEDAIDGVSWRVGEAAERYFARCATAGAPRYDFLVSRSTLEHLYDPLGALRAMAGSLAPGGRMIHKIDLRDHGMFTPRNHELTFLTIPAALYRRMTRFKGRPNRVLVHRYRQELEALRGVGLRSYDLLVTGLAGVGDIVPHRRIEEVDRASIQAARAFVRTHRHTFAREFAGVDDIDLAVTGVFLIAE